MAGKVISTSSRRRAILAPPPTGPGSRTNARRHAQLFVLGLIVTVLVGTVFLAMPWVTRNGQRTAVIDAFFTAVSASSVTGLVVVDTLDHWNWWGQFVILLLIQIGGLGFAVGASLLLQMLRRGAGAYTLRDELLLKDGAPALSVQEAVYLAGRIVRFTIVIELIGAAMLAARFAVSGAMQPRDALWNGLFIAISAFCNAGFDLFGGFHSFQTVTTDVWINVVVMALIQAGALSYIVFADVTVKRSWRPLSLDTKIVLSLNTALLAAGALVFLAAEWGAALAGLAPESKVLAALFQTVAARTAGFTSIDWNLANPLTLFFWLGLMFVGGSSGSTAGGVRLNTVGVVLAAVVSTVRGHAETQVWGRRVATPLVFRAVTVVAIFLTIYGAATSLLAIAENHISHNEIPIIDLTFETMSALATVGLSTGITPALSVAGKLVLCAAMFVGRLGPLTVVYALQRHQAPARYRFPEEAVRIG
ncbi:MAG: trk system potassium uptake protein TrkH [Thermomicrobiales bacterium]|nr:trk system potassium uptake protein TrkH [Thermomicrobiales bacterium]